MTERLTDIENKIYSQYEKAREQQAPRTHLGGSGIGHECHRKIWYEYRWCETKKKPGRLLRLFDHGQKEEARVIADLRAAGLDVLDLDPSTGKQWAFVDAASGLSGSLDGVVVMPVPGGEPTYALLEIKTHNEKSFKDLEKKGVAKAKPLHLAQMHTYMGLAGLEFALYFAVNKNTDDLYIEWISFDAQQFEWHKETARKVIGSRDPPERVSKDPAFFVCKFCDFSALCWGSAVARPSCRTCMRYERGTCGLDGRELGAAFQVGGCVDHAYVPDLIGFAEVVGAENATLKYRNKLTDHKFWNVPGTMFPVPENSYSSEEIYSMEPLAVGDPAVGRAKRVLGGTAGGVGREPGQDG